MCEPDLIPDLLPRCSFPPQLNTRTFLKSPLSRAAERRDFLPRLDSLASSSVLPPVRCRSQAPCDLGETMSVFRTQDPGQFFRRIERTTRLIVRHPDFPGKEETVQRCREEIEQRFQQGMLSDEQR